MKLKYPAPPYVLVTFEGWTDSGVYVSGFRVMEEADYRSYMEVVDRAFEEVGLNAFKRGAAATPSLKAQDESRQIAVSWWTAAEFAHGFDVHPLTADEAQVLFLTFNLQRGKPEFGFFPEPEIDAYLKAGGV